MRDFSGRHIVLHLDSPHKGCINSSIEYKNKPHIKTPSARFVGLISSFVVGGVIAWVLRNQIAFSHTPLVGWIMIAAYVVVGPFSLSSGTKLSRLTSGCAMFVLGVIAVHVADSAIPVVYLYLSALAVSATASLRFLHTSPGSKKQAAALAIFVLLVTLVAVALFVYIEVVAGHIALAR